MAEVFAPIDGEVVAVNDSLADAPEKVNDDPHGEGWLVRVKTSSADALGELMDASGYREFVDGD